MKKLKQNFWNDDVRASLTKYIQETDEDKKLIIYNELHIPINTLILIGINKYNLNGMKYRRNKEDNK